jgi:hypothetical protein
MVPNKYGRMVYFLYLSQCNLLFNHAYRCFYVTTLGVELQLPSGDHSLHLRVQWFYGWDHTYGLVVRGLLAKYHIHCRHTAAGVPHVTNLNDFQGNCILRSSHFI